MCLAINNKVKVEFDENGYAIVYKELYVSMDMQLITPYAFSPVWFGEYVSNRERKELEENERYYGVVDHGIHVYLDEKGATCDYTAKCKAHKDDLVSTGLFCGYRSAVFMKVTVEDIYENKHNS